MPAHGWVWLLWASVAFLMSWQEFGRLQDNGDWDALAKGAHLLVGEQPPLKYDETGQPIGVDTSAGGLSLYATHPQLQIGPLALAVTRLAMQVPLPTSIAIRLVGLLLGVPILLLVVRLGRPRSTRTLALGGAIVAVVVADMAAHWGHIDDLLVVMSLLGAATILRAPPRWVVHREWLALGVVLGLGVAAKPTALPALALVAALHHRRSRAAFAAVAVIAAAWLPFVVAAPATLLAGAWRIIIRDDSVLDAVGMSGLAPGWVRPAQLVLATSLALALARKDRVRAAVVAVVLGRLAFEPGWFSYHVGTLIIALVVWELAEASWPLPLGSAAALALMMEGVRLLPADVRLLRLVGTIALLALLVTLAARTQPRARRGLTSRMRASSPLTNDADSSVDSDFASSTASEMATAGGTSSHQSSS